jgi:hypothetical protein
MLPQRLDGVRRWRLVRLEDNELHRSGRTKRITAFG